MLNSMYIILIAIAILLFFAIIIILRKKSVRSVKKIPRDIIDSPTFVHSESPPLNVYETFLDPNNPTYQNSEIRREFPPILNDAPPEIINIQIGCLRVLFGKFGISYIPQLALDSLCVIDKNGKEYRFDALNCFFNFVEVIGLNIDLLCDQNKVLEREKFSEICGILLEVDEIRRNYNISPIPLYNAFQNSILEVENRLEKMKLIVDALMSAENSGIRFHSFLEWLKEVKNKLQHWEQYDLSDINNLLGYVEYHKRLMLQCNNLLTEIEDIRNKISTLSLSTSELAAIEKDVIILQGLCEYLFNGVDTFNIGGLTIERAIEFLKEVRDQLKIFYENLLGTYSSPVDDKITKAFEELEMDPTDDFNEIKKQYRKLAKMYHPDCYHEPSEKKRAEEKFKKLNEAYRILEDKFKCGGLS